MKYKIQHGSAQIDGKLYKSGTANNIIETEDDLLRFNSTGSPKFVPIAGNPQPAGMPEEIPLPDGPTKTELKNMDKDELIEYAAENEIDLGNSSSEEGIRKKIWNAVGIDDPD